MAPVDRSDLSIAGPAKSAATTASADHRGPRTARRDKYATATVTVFTSRYTPLRHAMAPMVPLARMTGHRDLPGRRLDWAPVDISEDFNPVRFAAPPASGPAWDLAETKRCKQSWSMRRAKEQPHETFR